VIILNVLQILHLLLRQLFTMPLLCPHFILHKNYTIFHMFHPVFYFNLSFCVILLHNFLILIFLIIKLLHLIIRSSIFQSYKLFSPLILSSCEDYNLNSYIRNIILPIIIPFKDFSIYWSLYYIFSEIFKFIRSIE